LRATFARPGCSVLAPDETARGSPQPESPCQPAVSSHDPFRADFGRKQNEMRFPSGLAGNRAAHSVGFGDFAAAELPHSTQRQIQTSIRGWRKRPASAPQFDRETI
jgi:hypothetical protein